jgi:hypothetical protein
VCPVRLRRTLPEASGLEESSLPSRLLHTRTRWLLSKLILLHLVLLSRVVSVIIMPPHAYRQQHSSQHSPRSNNSSHTTGSTSCLPFVPRQQARPLYRPASLRRSSPSPHPPRSSSVTQYNSHAESRSTSPPASPSLAVVEQKQTWLGGLLSPLTDHKEFRFDVVQPSGSPAGSMCSLKSWRVSNYPTL